MKLEITVADGIDQKLAKKLVDSTIKDYVRDTASGATFAFYSTSYNVGPNVYSVVVDFHKRIGMVVTGDYNEEHFPPTVDDGQHRTRATEPHPRHLPIKSGQRLQCYL